MLIINGSFSEIIDSNPLNSSFDNFSSVFYPGDIWALYCFILAADISLSNLSILFLSDSSVLLHESLHRFIAASS